MMMDWQIGLLWLFFVIIAAVGLLYISMAVTKEKSYDEAIAEQRQQTSMLLGTQNKSKLKDKKQKKAGKKVKEKLPTINNDTGATKELKSIEVTLPDTTPDLPSPQPKHRVEFKEPQILEEPVKEITKRRSKMEKVRPILSNRDMSVEKIMPVDEVPLANHFEQLHPKDDFELMHSHIQKEEAIKQELPTKEKLTKLKQLNPTRTEIESNDNKSNKKTSKPQSNEDTAQNTIEKVEKEEPVVEQESITPQTNGNALVANNSSAKEKRKKKSEQNTIQQLASDKQGVNLQILTTLVRKAELSRSEVQILIDMLLNKQHEAPSVIDEWSEGKADPVQKLKKQLAEKEKLLVEEQEALIGAQAKLKEVRAEQVAERSQLQQKARGLEEALSAKQLELQATNNRIHGLNQKLQALQTQLNEEIMKNHKLIEDHNALKMHLQQLEIRGNQFEEMKETMENDFRSLNDQFEKQKSIVMHQQYELSQKDELNKQLEEQRIDMEHHINAYMMQINEHKNEIQLLKSACQQHIEESKRLELNESQTISELNTQREEYEKTISQLSQELQRIKDEKQKLEICRENDIMEEKKTQIRIKNLQNELSSHLVNIETLKSELEQQKVKNNELREKNWKVMEALNAAENRNKKQATLNIESEFTELKQERLAEKKMLQRLFPTANVDDRLPYDQRISKMEICIKSFIDNLKTPTTVVTEVSSEAADNSEVMKLQRQIQQNKESLDEYDDLLNKLQKRAAEAEIKWQEEISIKNTEIATRDKAINDKDNKINLVEQEMICLQEQKQQLHARLSELETQLLEEQQINKRLTSDGAPKLHEGKSAQTDNITLEVEKLHEEMDRMSKELLEEQITNKDLRIQIEEISNLSAKTINHNSASNGPSVAVEHN